VLMPAGAVPGSARGRDLSIEAREKYRAFPLAGNHTRVLYSGGMSDDDGSGGSWTLLTGHGHVLVEIARNPDARIRDISPASFP
jgi:hypothetical protein